MLIYCHVFKGSRYSRDMRQEPAGYPSESRTNAVSTCREQHQSKQWKLTRICIRQTRSRHAASTTHQQLTKTRSTSTQRSRDVQHQEMHSQAVGHARFVPTQLLTHAMPESDLQPVGHVVEALLQVLHRSVRRALVPVLDDWPAQVVLERQLNEVIRLELRPRSVLPQPGHQNDKQKYARRKRNGQKQVGGR